MLVIALIGGAAYAWFVPRAVTKEAVPVQPESIKTALFAGGCFWCTESDFEKLDGVIEAISGYSGGTAETATYDQTSSKTTDHREVVQVQYDTTKLSYKDLADYHLRHVNPTDNQGQFVDRGFVYSPALFYETLAEKQAAEMAVAEVETQNIFASALNIAIEEAAPFYPAETYHQDYYLKNPVRYQYYRNGSGRDQFLDTTWSSTQ